MAENAGPWGRWPSLTVTRHHDGGDTEWLHIEDADERIEVSDELIAMLIETSPYRTMRELREEFRAAHPDPSDPVAHTLSVYAGEPDEAFVIVASGNIYGEGVRTGLTWGDLRRLAAQNGDSQAGDHV